MLVKLLSALIVLENSLIEILFKLIFVLYMNNYFILRLAYLLTANECTTTNTLTKVLWVSCDNVFGVHNLIGIA